MFNVECSIESYIKRCLQVWVYGTWLVLGNENFLLGLAFLIGWLACPNMKTSKIILEAKWIALRKGTSWIKASVALQMECITMIIWCLVCHTLKKRASLM